MTTIEPLATHEATYDAFINGRLGKDEWTHEAHLVTCWMALKTRTPREALVHLRTSIQEHNCGIGIQNTAYSGYHETLTVYYVTAVVMAGADRPEDLYDHPWCDRKAPGRHWSREVLFSPEARAAWVEPELEPLPWSVAGTRD